MQKTLIERCSQIEGAAIGESAFAPGPAVWVGQPEVAHFDADGALDDGEAGPPPTGKDLDRRRRSH